MIHKGYTFDDLLLIPSYTDISSRKDVDPSVKLGDLTLKAGIISSNMDKITEHEMAIKMWELGGIGMLHRFMSLEKNIEEYLKVKKANAECIISLGINEGFDRFLALYENNARIFCLDTAYAYTKNTGKFLKQIKDLHSDIFVIAGNVVSYAGADYLSGCHADAIKVGLGSGGFCLTRIKTSVGYPQLSAIMNCSRINKPILADGGIKTSGHFCSAIAAGAKFAVIGSLLAGTLETPGEIKELTTDSLECIFKFYKPGKYKSMRGMASKSAQEDYFGKQEDWKTSEGASSYVKLKGSAKEIIDDMIGGLRSSMSYCGSHNIEEYQRRAEWVEITHNGYIEGTAHGIE